MQRIVLRRCLVTIAFSVGQYFQESEGTSGTSGTSARDIENDPTAPWFPVSKNGLPPGR